MHSLSKDAMRKLSERNSELLELARALEDKVAQHSQEKELSNLRAIIRQSASELLRLEKIIAENNSQNTHRLDELRQANWQLEQQNRDLLQRIVQLEKLVENCSSEHRKFLSELEDCQSLKTQLEYRVKNVESDLEYVKLMRTTVRGRLRDDDDNEEDFDIVEQRSWLNKLENECQRLVGGYDDLQRDVHELCGLVVDIASTSASHRNRNVVDVATSRDSPHTTSQRRATRRFVVRFNYDPFKMSPNADPESELSLIAGEYVTVFGSVDSDGFYYGQTADDRRGLIPSNYLEMLPDAAVSDAKPQALRNSEMTRQSVLRLPTTRRRPTPAAAVATAHRPSQSQRPASFVRRRSTQRARWRGRSVGVAVGPTRRATTSASTKARQDTSRDSRVGQPATVATSSNRQRLPGLPQPASATAATGLGYHDNKRAQTRYDVADGRAGADRLRDHWSQSSYSLDEQDVLVTEEVKAVQRPVYRHQDIARSKNNSAALTATRSVAAGASNHRGETGRPSKVRLRDDVPRQTPITDYKTQAKPRAPTTSDTTNQPQSWQMNSTNKRKNEIKGQVNSEHAQTPNNVTSAAATKDAPHRKQRDEAGDGGRAATRVTVTTATRNDSYDVDSGASGGTGSYGDGQSGGTGTGSSSQRDGPQASSSADNKSTGATKQGGGGLGILGCGQKLFKHLANRT